MNNSFMKILKDELYSDFEVSLDEWLFEYMTENIHYRCEKMVCAAKGIDYVDYINDSGGELYDAVWHDACEMSQDMLHELKRQYNTGEVYNG